MDQQEIDKKVTLTNDIKIILYFMSEAGNY